MGSISSIITPRYIFLQSFQRFYECLATKHKFCLMLSYVTPFNGNCVTDLKPFPRTSKITQPTNPKTNNFFQPKFILLNNKVLKFLLIF